MCRIGAHQDFHGLGVANIVFGVVCLILPDHAAYDANNFDGIDQSIVDFIRATAALTVLNGLLFLTAGILLMVLARRMVENLDVQQVTQIALGFLIVSILMCPITFALNLIGTNDASDVSVPTDSDSTGTGAVGNLTIDVGVFLANFIVIDRALDYKYGSSAALTLIAVGAFVMNITCCIIICKQRSFRCFGRSPVEPAQMTVVAAPDTTRIQYQNQINDDRAVVIQPLPERPGLGGAHGHFADASVPAYRNPAFA